MNPDEIRKKYGNVYDAVLESKTDDKYNKKYLLLTPDNYDSEEILVTETQILNYNKNLYKDPFSTGEYNINLKTDIMTKIITVEYVEFYNTWPQLHDYSTPDVIADTPVPNVILNDYYKPVYFTVAISTTGDNTGYIAYALEIGPNSFTVQEYVAYFNANFLPRGLTMTINEPNNSLEITTVVAGLRFYLFPMDINFTLTPLAFTVIGWHDPFTNVILATQPVIIRLDNLIRYNMGFTSTPFPTFGYVAADPFSTFNVPYSIANLNLPAFGINAFIFDMEEFIFLRIIPFNSTMMISNSSQFQSFMIPNSAGRGEINQFNSNTNFKYSIFFENKIVLNKLNIKWSFYSGQTCRFYGISPIILISYIPYETTDSRVPFYLE